MSINVYIDNIQKLLFSWVDIISHSNSLNRGNDAVDAEGLVAGILNTAFDWALRNANADNPNQDSFDLANKSRTLIVQVTSNKQHKQKQQKTIQSFTVSKHKSNSRLLILFLSKECAPSLLKKKAIGDFEYEGFHVPKLCKKIYHECHSIEKLKLINKLLEDAIAPVLIRPLDKQTESGHVKLPEQTIPKQPKGVYINRQSLVNEIFAFGQSGNGLIVGGPGMGKSSVLNELQRTCRDKKIPCFIIRINELAEVSNEEIKEALGIQAGNWIRELKKVHSQDTGEKSFLIFDAFDTAKDEHSKQFILQSARKAMKELANNWTILVTSRTFDASKSYRLIELFPHTNIHNAISCRHITIGELTGSELSNALASTPVLSAAYLKSTAALKNLLRIPYFFKLFENILQDTSKAELSKIYAIETEEQLLKTYWDKKVTTQTGTSIFLGKLTTLLAEKQNLSCRRNQIVNENNALIYDELTSLGVVEETSTTHQNICFSHNILLEYAISIYTIPEEAPELVEYIKANPRFPFSFLQSFVYFYNRLWRFNQQLFWQHYFSIKDINEPVFRLFHQNILNFVLGSFYSSTKQLDIIFSLPDAEKRSNVISKILEGIRFINKEAIREKDYDLLLKASQYAHINHIWILGLLIEKAIEQLKHNSDKKRWDNVAKASLLYFKFVLDERNLSSQRWRLDENGGLWGIQNLCSVFHVKAREAKGLITKTLSILKEDNFPIRYFRSLAVKVNLLFRYDPEFGKRVYTAIYFHIETSNAATQFGGPVLALRSYRSQDFHLIHYQMEESFPEILHTSPEAGIELGIEIVNRSSNSAEKFRRKIPSFSLLINGQQARLIPDFFFYDFSDEDKEGPNALIEKMFSFLESLIGSSQPEQANRLIDILIQQSEAARLWRRLMKLFFKYPFQFKTVSLSLLLNEAIFVCDETFYDAGELLRHVWKVFNSKERIKIEKEITDLPASRYFIKKQELATERVKTLLTCIPYEELRLKRTKEFMETYGKGNKNSPFLTRPRLESYTPSEDETIARMGITSSSKTEMHAFALLRVVEAFNKKYELKSTLIPDKADYEPLIPTLKELWETTKIENLLNDTLLSKCDYEISRFAHIITRNKSKLNKDTRLLAESVGIHYLKTGKYNVPSYQEGSLKNRTGVFSMTPRVTATYILTQLVSTDKEGNLPVYLLNLFSDNLLFVRFEVLHSTPYFWHFRREDFWKIVEDRVQKESDGMCLREVIRSVCYDNIIADNQSKAENFATLAFTKLSGSGEEPMADLWRVCVVLLLKLFIKYNSSVAKEILYRKSSSKAYLRSLVLEIAIVIDPHEKKNDYSHQPGRHDNLLLLIRFVLQNCFDNIRNNGLDSSENRDDFEIIDLCVQQLYFTSCMGKGDNRNTPLDEKNKKAFYFKIKSLLRFIVDESVQLESGFMVAGTGYYFMQMLNSMLAYDSAFVLHLSADIVRCAAANHFTYDPSTIQEIVKLTEQLLADHKQLLLQKEHFNNLITILDLFANSGSQEALELTWRLKDIF